MSFQLNQAYNRESFLEFLSNKFLPEDFRPKRDVEEIELSGSQNFATRAFRLGECRSLELEVFEILHSSLNDARVGIAKDAFQLLLHHSFCNRALIAFVPEGSKQWRFSLLQADITLDNNKVRRAYSNPRRFSFLLGEDTAIKTPTQFLIEKERICQRTENGKTLSPWEDLVNRFSVEVLTKEFYEKLFNWYLWAKDSKTGVTFPNNPQTVDDDRDKMEIKMIRLITRMLFVWFIKQKHLVPNYLFDTDYLKTILKDFDPLSSKQGNYYNAILQNLFFATLNQEQDKRAFIQPSFQGKGESYGVKTLYRDNQRQSWFTFPEDKKEEEVLKIFSSIPYLNGGLFECLDKFDLNENGKYRPITYYDGFSTHDKLSENKKNFKYRAFIPNELFFLDKPTKVTVETGEVQVIGLIELFKQYNFTVEENTTTDAEVSLDPELLGRVFENLLADYNPDTQQSARKSTGSYYTPREIVDYMVDESLKAYLTGECQNNKEEVDSLFADGKVSSSAVAEKINHDLRFVKVLDPACGSGAFPMGILLRITELIGHLEGEKFNRYETKLQLLKDCIYGIDIQAIAMLICKLRFFISLICDCEKDETKPNLGIIPLPNLETKFVAANSLMPAKVKEFDNDLLHDDALQEMKERLLGLRKSILEVRHTRRKMEIRKEDRKLCEQIQKYIIEQASKPDEEKIARLRNVIEECEAELPKYKEDYWVDEMVTQTSLFDTGEPTIFRRNINKEKRDELNARIRNAQADIRREENKTTQDGFFEAVKQVTNWDPYDQNADSPFFDAEWMFGIGISRPSKQGFDIVIGNPPYGAKLSDEDKAIYKKIYVTSQTIKGVQKGSLDTYTLFIEMGYNMLRPDATLTYIVPISFTSSEALTGVHKLLMDNCQSIKVSSYAVRPEPVFPNAMVNTSIIRFEKTLSPCEQIYTTKMHRKKGNDFSLKKLVDNLQFVEVNGLTLVGRIPKIGTTLEKQILKTILSLPKLGNLISKEGYPIYYRFAGGRYFKVITNYSTGSSAEKAIYFNDEKLANAIGCILSSNLSFWFYQIFSDNLNWKSYEVENFTIPNLTAENIDFLDKLYARYLKDIEANANNRTTSGESSYNVDSFKEYKIVRSKSIIDEIDDYICPLYGLTKDETEFIKNYELEFRMAGE